MEKGKIMTPSEALHFIDSTREKQASRIIEVIVSDFLINNPYGDPQGTREVTINQDADYKTELSDSLIDTLFKQFSNPTIMAAVKDVKATLEKLGYTCNQDEDDAIVLEIHY